MSQFINDRFLLSSDKAYSLYEDYAKPLPIVDYHCHIDPKDIAENVSFTDLSSIWLSGDHYKWRLMRANGIPEMSITGDASPKEKFICWAKTIGNSIGSPLYHWNCLELARYFDIFDPLTEKNVEDIWDKTCKMMADDPEKYTARGLIKASNVKVICTTDDPCDDLKWHKMIKDDPTFDTMVLPSFRPDPILDIEKDSYGDYIARLSLVCGHKIDSLDDLLKAIDMRIDHFVSKRLQDRRSRHGISLFRGRNKGADREYFREEKDFIPVFFRDRSV